MFIGVVILKINVINQNEIFSEKYIYIYIWLLSDEGPMLETLDYSIRIGSAPTFLYFDIYYREG